MGAIIQLRANTSGGTESALAAFDVPKDGGIVGVAWSVSPIWDTTLDNGLFQVSFGSTISLTNDSRQVISNLSIGNLVFTAGGTYVAGGSFHDAIPDVQVSMGERIFLHSASAAAMVATVIALVQFTFDLDQPRARRR